MHKGVRNLLLLIVVSALLGVGVWALLRYKALQRWTVRPSSYVSNLTSDHDRWTRSVEKVKEDRGEGGGVAVETPTELRHYSDRHWFLATQVAEVRKFTVPSCQDFVDLASMIQRGEMVTVPGITDDYILFGVGEEADDAVFSRYENGQNIKLYDDTELHDAYARLESARSKLQTEISSLKTQEAKLKKKERTKQGEPRKQIAAREQDLKSNNEDKALLDRFYGQPDSRQKLLKDYESLQALAKNFGGRSYDLDNSSDRQAMKRHMLSSLRHEGLKILEEVARHYHERFDRPLPISSLVRPEQYQHVLRRVNRNAVLIDTPPHSTGLAFDIDYRYMSGAEQNFLMGLLARIENEGRIEVIRERNANYHVFAFIDGRRPSDELIAASLDEASGWTLSDDASDTANETHHSTRSATKAESKSRVAKKANSKAKKSTSKSRAKKRRR